MGRTSRGELRGSTGISFNYAQFHFSTSLAGIGEDNGTAAVTGKRRGSLLSPLWWYCLLVLSKLMKEVQRLLTSRYSFSHFNQQDRYCLAMVGYTWGGQERNIRNRDCSLIVVKATKKSFEFFQNLIKFPNVNLKSFTILKSSQMSQLNLQPSLNLFGVA